MIKFFHANSTLADYMKYINSDIITNLFQDFNIYNKVQCPFCGEIFDKETLKKCRKWSFYIICSHVHLCRVEQEKRRIFPLLRKTLRTFVFKIINEKRRETIKYDPGYKRMFERFKASKDKLYVCKYCNSGPFIGPTSMGNHTRVCAKNWRRNTILAKESAAQTRSYKKNQRKEMKELISSDDFKNLSGNLIYTEDDNAVGEL